MALRAPRAAGNQQQRSGAGAGPLTRCTDAPKGIAAGAGVTSAQGYPQLF